MFFMRCACHSNSARPRPLVAARPDPDRPHRQALCPHTCQTRCPNPPASCANAQLINRQRIHGIDEHRDDAIGRSLIAQPQAVIKDGIQEGFGLARAGSSRDQSNAYPHQPPAESHTGEQRVQDRGQPRQAGCTRPSRASSRRSLPC